MIREVEEKIELWELVGQLPERQARAVWLDAHDGYSQDEIAAKMGICQQRVCQLLKIGYKNLRRVLVKTAYLLP